MLIESRITATFSSTMPTDQRLLGTSENIRIRGEWGELEGRLSSLLNKGRYGDRPHGKWSSSNTNPSGSPLFDLSFTLLHGTIITSLEVIDQTPVFEKEKHFPEQIDIADEILADAGEGEPLRRVFPVLVDDEISVLLVDLGGSSDRALTEELGKLASFDFVYILPYEPTYHKPPKSISTKP